MLILNVEYPGFETAMLKIQRKIFMNIWYIIFFSSLFSLDMNIVCCCLGMKISSNTSPNIILLLNFCNDNEFSTYKKIEFGLVWFGSKELVVVT